MAMTLTDENKTLEIIANNVAKCQRCRLHEGRTKSVPGSGNPTADILFIGEGPGKNEDLQGEPFVGAAGRLLEEMLAAIKLSRKDVFITNVVKCRPPDNRDPEPDEVLACTEPWLNAQVELINPKLIVTLGRHSLERFIPGKRISECHGKPMRAAAPGGTRRVFYPVYHPAAALYQGSLKETLMTDFKRIPVVLKAVDSAAEKNKLLEEMAAPDQL